MMVAAGLFESSGEDEGELRPAHDSALWLQLTLADVQRRWILVKEVMKGLDS